MPPLGWVCGDPPAGNASQDAHRPRARMTLSMRTLRHPLWPAHSVQPAQQQNQTEEGTRAAATPHILRDRKGEHTANSRTANFNSKTKTSGRGAPGTAVDASKTTRHNQGRFRAEHGSIIATCTAAAIHVALNSTLPQQVQ